MIYADAAASALKPESVIRAETDFLRTKYANAGRGICARADAVDKMVAESRVCAAEFVGAKSADNIIWTGGATDGLNRVLRMLDASGVLGPDSVALVSDLDHHSARLPWEDLARRGGCRLAVCPLDRDFNLDASKVAKADVFVITAMSNVFGTAQDVKGLAAAARAKNPDAVVIVDAAQYAAHRRIEAAAWDCDFLCLSGHKIGADTGLGVMYVKEPDRWHPDKMGGGMVGHVMPRAAAGDGGDERKNKSGMQSEWTTAPGPGKFEAGTLPLTQIAGFRFAAGELIGYMAHDARHEMLRYLRDELSAIPRVRLVSGDGAALLTFATDGMHPLDFGARAGARGVCLRAGNMCASWAHHALGLSGTIRISVGWWNTMDEMARISRVAKDILGRE